MRWLAILCLWLAAWSPVAAQTFPPLSGRVVDAANVIPDDQETAITAKLKGVEDQSGRQFVVATIPSLQGYPPEDYGYRLGRAWGIGQKGENNGIILLVAPNERKVRIEVGYGLEPVMTDALSSVIINTQIIPRFKAGDLPGGIVAGVDAIVPQLTLPADQAEKRARLAGSERRDSGGGGNAGGAIFWLVVFLFVILPIVMRLFRKRGRRYGGGFAPVVIWGPGDWGGGGGGGSFGDVFSGGGGSFGGGGASGDW
jgi:uncharacterized protein